MNTQELLIHRELQYLRAVGAGTHKQRRPKKRYRKPRLYVIERGEKLAQAERMAKRAGITIDAQA